MHLTAAESKMLDAIDEAAIVAHLERLVRTPSITGSDTETELQHESAAELDQLGFDVDSWKFDLDALTADPRFPGTEAPRTEAHGVVGTLGGAGTPALVLQGHVDVVPIGDVTKWAHNDPFSALIEGGVLHGRGACDMKAGVAVNFAVARALRASGLVLERPFAIHSVISEEDGGLGAFGTMLRGHGGDAAVLTEPTSGRIVVANAGALTFELSVPGRAAHGSTRLAGMSAIDAFLPLYAALRHLETERNRDPDPLFAGQQLPYPISVGTVHAGDWASSVPDLLTATGRLGVRLDEDPARARAALEASIAATCNRDPWLSENPATVTWPGGQFASGRIDAAHPFVDEVAGCIGALSGRPEPDRVAAAYGSDLRLYSGLGGIPTLHYGPGDVTFAHAPREQVVLEDVFTVARSMALLTVRRCGAHVPQSRT